MIETLDRPEEKLAPTPIRAGAWHIVWWLHESCRFTAGAFRMGEELWLGTDPFPSSEVAEQKAMEAIEIAVAEQPPLRDLLRFERAEFISEGE